MRLNLPLSPNTEAVPYEHLHELTGALHKWIGPENTVHDALSLYSFGWLQGGQSRNGALTFPRGALWRISFHDDALAKQALAGIMRDPEVMYGMRVVEVQEQAVPAFSGRFRFMADGPVLARNVRTDGTRAYLLWKDLGADEALTRILRRKLQAAGFQGDHLAATVRFDPDYRNPRTKLAEIKGTKHKGSVCPVIVEGTPEAVRFAWLVGAGDLTGSGFGALR